MDKPKILIIDDDKDLCDSLMDTLEFEGYLAEAAYTADEGIKKLRSGGYNVVLLDLRLPDSEGTELLERIKVLARNTEVIVFTAYASIDSAVEALGKGAFSFVQKPYEVPHLISVIEKAHGNQKILIEKTKLFARLETLNRISQTVAQSLDIGKILTGILREIFAVTGFNMGKICEFFDDKHSNLESEGLPHKLIEGLDGRSSEDTLCGEVIKSNKPVIIEKNLPDSPFVPATDAQFLINEGFESYVGIPIRLKQRPIAVLSLLDKKPRKLSPDILELLITICNQIGSSIVNSRLFQKVSEGKRDWENTFDSVSDLISIHDEDFNLIRCNKALAHKFNLKPEDLIGKKCYEVFHGFNEPFSNCPLAQSKQNLESVTVEMENTYIGGIFQISVFPRFGEQGEFIGIVQVARDITHQKMAEKQEKSLREISESLSKTLDFEAVSEVIFSSLGQIIPHHYIIMVSCDSDTETLLALAVKSRVESTHIKKGITAPLRDNPVYPAYKRKDIVYRSCEEIQKSKLPFDIEFIKKEGIKRDIIVPLMIGGDVIGFLIIACRNIDTPFFDEGKRLFLRKASDIMSGWLSNSLLIEKVSISEKKYRELFETINDGIVFTDLEGNILDCNKGFIDMLGYSMEEIRAMKYQDITPEKWHDMEEEIVKEQILKEGHSDLYEKEYVKRDGKVLPISIRMWCVKDKEGKANGMWKIVRDITRRKQYEERIMEASEINEILLNVSNIISTARNRQELVDKTIVTVDKYFDNAYCAIMLWDKDTRSFNTAGANGKEDSIVYILRTIRFKKPYLPLIERIIESKQSSKADIDDIDAKTGEFMREIRARSMLIAPLVSVGTITGFVLYYYAGSGDSRTFSHKESAVVEGLTRQLSIGVENARLYEELMNKTTTLENNLEVISVMRELDRTILSTLEPVQIFEVSTQLVDRIIPCDRVTVVLIDRERGGFIYKAGWGIELEKGAFVKFEDTNTTEVVRTKRPIVRLNIAEEENLLPLDKLFLEQGFLSDIRVPLIIKGEVYGLLNVGSRRRAGFTQEHISAAADIGTQVSVALSNATLVTELKELYFNTVKSLSEAIDAKSEWTRGHSDRVTDIAMSTGEELGLGKEDMENLRFAAMLHDIGKIGTYEYILDKKEPLTEAEQKVIKGHPVKGAEIIGGIKQFKDVTPGVRHHHERYDGGGYPDGLSGKEIPLFARIINVADSFDAMTADRPYRKGLSREKGIEEVKKNSGTQFDPEIVEAFLRKIEESQTPC